jgi:putative SOS response-associated peptidase YedK
LTARIHLGTNENSKHGSVRASLETAAVVCGRFTSSQRREAIGERFEVAVPEAYQERYNLAPQQRTLIIREPDGERDAVMAKWGLLPHWAKDSKIAFKMINARAETLTDKPAYRGLIGKYRCLIPADGFYEWTVGRDGKKQPIHFHLPGYDLFTFAGLWTARTDDAAGEVIESCTIITTTPNELVTPVHSPYASDSAGRLRGRIARSEQFEGTRAVAPPAVFR